MKLRHWFYRIPNGPDHDRLLDQLLTRATNLGLNMERAAVSDGQNAASVVAFVGIIPEPGLDLSPGIERVNRALEELRACCSRPGSVLFKPDGGPPPYQT